MPIPQALVTVLQRLASRTDPTAWTLGDAPELERTAQEKHPSSVSFVTEPSLAKVRDNLLRKAEGHRFLRYQWTIGQLPDAKPLSDELLDGLLLASVNDGIVVLGGGSPECIDPLVEALEADEMAKFDRIGRKPLHEHSWHLRDNPSGAGAVRP